MQFKARMICTLLLAAMAFETAAAAHADALTVKTAQGKVHGKTINNDKVRAYLGLPYAAPPVGLLRWKPPQPPAKWKGVREATQYGARCMQRPVFPDMVFQDAGPSEDCLFLNVFTPAVAKAKSKLPVMFWIHGGGYEGGSASEPRHNGDFLPLKGVVLVTINYRLDVFGFLATSELAQEGTQDAHGAAGNYGLMDMAAALQWVRANIARFGGDPGNVTIFGESAGSFAVSTLMAAAPAQGLFQKAIGESGGALRVGSSDEKTLAEKEQQEEAWVASLGAPTPAQAGFAQTGLAQAGSAQPGLAQLRALPAATILDAAGKQGAPKFSPVVDGAFLTEPIAQTYAEGKQAHVPLLAGWNRDEGGPLHDPMTAAQWKDIAEKTFGENAVEFLSLYPGDTDEQAGRSAIDYDGDTFIAFSTWRWIEAQVKTGQAPVYRYHFELPAPPSKFHRGSFAFHSDDIEYVFGTLDTRPEAEWRPEDRKLSDEVMDYWTNFARTGDPNGAGLLAWPRFDKDGEVLHLDSDTNAAPDTTRARYEFLEKWMPRPTP
jgi:para-nitrobenzyl esterase